MKNREEIEKEFDEKFTIPYPSEQNRIVAGCLNGDINRRTFFVPEVIKSHISKIRQDDVDEFGGIIADEFFNFNEIEQDFDCNQRVLKLRNKIIYRLQALKEKV